VRVRVRMKVIDKLDKQMGERMCIDIYPNPKTLTLTLTLTLTGHIYL
jgi:hypothetical protein